MAVSLNQAQVEADVREFARLFPTPNVLAMLAYCEAGTITWEQAYGLAQRSLAAGNAAVKPQAQRCCDVCGDDLSWCPTNR